MYCKLCPTCERWSFSRRRRRVWMCTYCGADLTDQPFGSMILLHGERTYRFRAPHIEVAVVHGGERTGHRAGMTAQEQEVLQGVVMGESIEEMASRIGTEPSVVEHRLTRLLQNVARRYRIRDELDIMQAPTGSQPSSHEAQSERIIQHEIARARRTGLPLSVVYMAFSTPADMAGALSEQRQRTLAKRTLRATARSYVSTVRETDMLVRWGDDALVSLLPATDLEGARRAVARLIAKLRDPGLATGVAQWQAEEPAVSLVDRASRALARSTGESAPSMTLGSEHA